MKKLLLILSAVIPFLFTGCKGDEDLKGVWEPVEITQNGVSYDVVDSYLELVPQTETVKVFGNAGVNTFTGEIKASDGKIECDGFATTRMMGAPDEMAFEDRFLEIISYADSYSVDEDMLVIKSSEKDGEVKFKKIRK